jgi:hypothetical protein
MKVLEFNTRIMLYILQSTDLSEDVEEPYKSNSLICYLQACGRKNYFG